MLLSQMNFSVPPSPIARFGDVARERYSLDLPTMATAWYQRLALDQAEARERERRAIDTSAAWQAERERFRLVYQEALGPFPPADVQVEPRGVIERPGVQVLKLLFSSHAGNWVPANIYLPTEVATPMPAIVLPCGHSHLGKAGYASRAMLLARNGYAAITFDLIGMGERHLAPDTPYAASTSHNVVGDRLPLAGCSLGWFLVQEAMAAVTVLQRLPEIDPGRIGITGSSGGGWLTVHAAALDERLKVAVPAAAVSSHRFQIRPDDAEQAMFDMVSRGIHYPDLIGLLICPRPVFIVANSHDIWGIEGTEYAYAEAARFYAMQGARERLGMQIWDRGHQYDNDQVAVGLRWFNRWLKGKPDAEVITDIAPEDAIPMDELAVCRDNSLFAEGSPRPNRIFWNFAASANCAKADLAGCLADLRAAVTAPTGVAWDELDRFTPGSGSGKRLAYQPEAGILLPVDVLIPARPRGILLLVDEGDRRGDLDWQMRGFHDRYAVFRPDLRGWGETAPPAEYADREGWSRSLYDSRGRQLHALAQMVGRNLVYDRARDLLALVEVARQLLPGLEITVWGRRQGALVALFAALADERIARLRLDGCLASFRELMVDDLPMWGPEGHIHGMLRHGLDLPDLLAAWSGTLLDFSSVDGCLRPTYPNVERKDELDSP